MKGRRHVERCGRCGGKGKGEVGGRSGRGELHGRLKGRCPLAGGEGKIRVLEILREGILRMKVRRKGGRLWKGRSGEFGT